MYKKEEKIQEVFTSERLKTKNLGSKINVETQGDVLGESLDDIRFLNDRLENSQENINYQITEPQSNESAKKQKLSQTERRDTDSDLSDRQKPSFKKQFSLSKLRAGNWKKKSNHKRKKDYKSINNGLQSSCLNSIQARMLHMSHRSSVKGDSINEKSARICRNKSNKGIKNSYTISHSKTHTKNKYKRKAEPLDLRQRTASLKLFNIDTCFGKKTHKNKLLI